MALGLDKIFLFRMTHIDNVSHILRYGITHVKSSNKNPNYKPIGDSSIILKRNQFRLPDGTLLGNYIPFYFGVRMPMLYVIQRGYQGVHMTKAQDIVYCVLSVQKVLDADLDFLFSDGHAIDSFSCLYSEKDVSKIKEVLDYTAIRAIYWNDPEDLDKKRRKEAEFLISGDIPINTIVGYCVYNDAAKDKLLALGIDEQRIKVKPEYYF